MDRQPPIGARTFTSADEGKERFVNKRGAKWGKGNNKKESALWAVFLSSLSASAHSFFINCNHSFS